MENSGYHLEDESFNLKKFFKRMFCKHPDYDEVEAWLKYTKGKNREVVIKYYLIKICKKCEKRKFMPLSKTYKLYRSEFKEELESITKTNLGEISEIEIEKIHEKPGNRVYKFNKVSVKSFKNRHLFR